jgi:tetratricopeptide (TPR) repeat protein
MGGNRTFSAPTGMAKKRHNQSSNLTSGCALSRRKCDQLLPGWDIGYAVVSIMLVQKSVRPSDDENAESSAQPACSFRGTPPSVIVYVVPAFIRGMSDKIGRTFATSRIGRRSRSNERTIMVINLFRTMCCAVLMGWVLLPASAGVQPNQCKNDSYIDFDEKAAVKACTALIESGKTSADALVDAYYNRGRIYATGTSVQPGFAIDDLDKLIALKPVDAEAYRLRGFTYYAMGQYSRAVSDLDQAIALKSDFAEAYFLRGEIDFGMRQYDRAVADYDKAIALQPLFFGTASAGRAEALRRARLFGPTVPAKADTENIVEPGKGMSEAFGACEASISPKNPPHSASAGDFLNCGKLYLFAAGYERNLLNYRIATGDDPPNIDDIVINRGHGKNIQAYEMMAEEAFSRAIALKPDCAEAYFYRSQISFHGPDNSSAIADLSRAIALKPDYTEAYGLRALAKLNSKDEAGAKADAQKAMTLLKNKLSIGAPD